MMVRSSSRKRTKRVHRRSHLMGNCEQDRKQTSQEEVVLPEQDSCPTIPCTDVVVIDGAAAVTVVETSAH